MINYLEKYNNLPKDLRDKISAPHVMEAIHDMEKKYSVNLAAIVMRVVVKDLRVDELQHFFVYNLGISSDKASELIKELKKKVFSEISNYLDYINESSESITKENKDQEESFGDIPEPGPKTNFEGIKIDNNKGADFYFSIEDEDEVRQQAKDLSSLDKREQIAAQVERKIESIIGQINVIFSSEDMLNRLKRILKTYLRGVRDKIDVKQALERKIENGGIGLDEEIADDIIKIVDLINKDEAQHPGRIVKLKKFSLPEDKQSLSLNKKIDEAKNQSLGGDVDYDFSKLNVAAKPEKKEAKDSVDEFLTSQSSNDDDGSLESADSESEYSEQKKNNDNPQKNKSKQDGGEKDDLVLDLSDEKETKDEKLPEQDNEDENEDENIFADNPIAKARNKPPLNIGNSEINLKQFGGMTDKIKMEDIKKVSKFGGPLEELGSMSLVDFRRFGKNSKEAIKKIMEMFELLEEEGFNKRMAGIKAWRQSPINKLYLAIGQESIIKKKDIKQVIEMRKKEKKEYLSEKEFNVIMELNKRLRY